MSLNKKSKIVLEVFEAEPGDKHNGDFYRYEREDLGAMGGSIKEITLQQNPYQRDKFELCLGLDKSDDYTRERALALLGAAGYAPEVKSNGNASGMRIMLRNIGENDLMKSVIALAQDIPNGRSDTHFALLSRDEASEIIAQELKRLKTTPLNAGLVNIKQEPMTADRRRELGVASAMGYMDIDFSGYPIGPVAFMREDAVPVGQFGATQMEISTYVELRDMKPEAMQGILAQEGIKSRKLSDDRLTVQAGADTVAMALGRKGLILGDIGIESALIAKQMRPDYVAAETGGQPLAPSTKAPALA